MDEVSDILISISSKRIHLHYALVILWNEDALDARFGATLARLVTIMVISCEEVRGST